MRPHSEILPTLPNEDHTEVGSLMLGSAPPPALLGRRCGSESWVGGLAGEGRRGSWGCRFPHSIFERKNQSQCGEYSIYLEDSGFIRLILEELSLMLGMMLGINY